MAIFLALQAKHNKSLIIQFLTADESFRVHGISSTMLYQSPQWFTVFLTVFLIGYDISEKIGYSEGYQSSSTDDYELLCLRSFLTMINQLLASVLSFEGAQFYHIFPQFNEVLSNMHCSYSNLILLKIQ